MPPDSKRFSAGLSAVPVITNWTVSGMRRALFMHEMGDFSLSGILADYLGRNPRIRSALASRVLAALGLEFTVNPPPSGDARTSEAIARDLRAAWAKIVPPGTLAELLECYHLLGFAVAELVWTTSATEWLPRLVLWPPSLVCAEDNGETWYVQTAKGRERVTPGDGKWFVLTASPSRAFLRGAVRVLGLPDSIRSFAVRDWARYSEVHGMPIRVAEVPADADDDIKDKFLTSVANMGTESTVLAEKQPDGKGFGVSLTEPKGNSVEAFKSLIELCNADIAIALLGSNLAVERTPGAYVPGTNGNDVKREYLKADVAMLAEALREQVLTPWVTFNRGPSQLGSVPVVAWDATAPVDKGASATALKTLGEAVTALNAAATGEGVRVDFKALAKAHGLPLLEGEAKPPKPPGGPPGIQSRGSLAKGSSGSPAAPLVAGQGWVDLATDAALERAPSAGAPVAEAILEAVNSSKSYDDLKAKLVALVGKTDTSLFLELLSASALAAHAAGGWSASRELG